MINDFDALEKRCRARRVKRILKISFMSVSSMILAIVGWVGWMQYNEPKAVSKSTSLTPSPMIVAKPSKPAVAEINETIMVSAPIPQVQKTEYDPKMVPSNTISSAKKTVAESAPLKSVVPTAVVSSSLPVSPPKQNLLEVTTSTANTESLIKEYERSPRYESALALAKDFYSKGDYPNASIWSKKANQHNREAEDAWILSAKSYYAQGKKAEAIGVLELYLNYKDSKTASELLKTWKR